MIRICGIREDRDHCFSFSDAPFSVLLSSGYRFIYVIFRYVFSRRVDLFFLRVFPDGCYDKKEKNMLKESWFSLLDFLL